MDWVYREGKMLNCSYYVVTYYQPIGLLSLSLFLVVVVVIFLLLLLLIIKIFSIFNIYVLLIFT